MPKKGSGLTPVLFAAFVVAVITVWVVAHQGKLDATQLKACEQQLAECRRELADCQSDARTTDWQPLPWWR